MENSGRHCAICGTSDGSCGAPTSVRPVDEPVQRSDNPRGPLYRFVEPTPTGFTALVRLPMAEGKARGLRLADSPPDPEPQPVPPPQAPVKDKMRRGPRK